MLGFTPFKKHANKFNYIPRYYDTAKEAREQPRAVLRGERPDSADRQYRPGEYSRTQREARAARRAGTEERGRVRVLKIAAAAVLMLLFIYLLYPKLADMVLQLRQPARPVPAAQAEGEFNPYAPIVGGPNDYQEEPEN